MFEKSFERAVKYKIFVTISLVIFFSLFSGYTQGVEQEFLLEPISVKLPKGVKSIVDVSCLIVDLKYDGESIKILELGNLNGSDFRSHEYVYGKDIIWQKLYGYLKGLGLHFWCVGSKFGSLKRLAELGCVRSFDLKRVNSCCSSCSSNVPKKLKLENYEWVLASEDHINLIKSNKKIKKYFPGVLFYNEITCEHVRDKLKTNMLFKDTGLSCFKPKWNVYPKIYSKELVEKIKQDFDTDILVIKPINASLGRGVIIVDRYSIDKTLKTIFTEHKKVKEIKDCSYSYWERDKNNIFLVESFEPSKLITLNNKLYDAKMKIMFVLACNGDTITLRFLGSYWKAPVKSIHEEGTLTEKHKSKIGKKGRIAKVDYEDAKRVQEILSYVLPKIYIHMMSLRENDECCK